MTRVLLIALFSMLLMTDSVEAQRGRLLQKLREDVFGAKPNEPTRSSEAQQTTRVPTPANGYSNRNDGYRSPQGQRNPQAYRGSQPLRSPQAQRGQQPTRNQPRSTAASGRSGFGFEVSMSGSDKIFVSRVDPRGNAAEAGIRRGDEVVEIGGIESKSTEEFEEIVKVMQPGDQMEFSVARGGSKKKITVQFGELPDVDPSQISSSPDTSAAPARQSTSGSRRYDFAPPANIDSRSRSVLENPVPATPAASRNQVQQRFSDQPDPRQIQAMQQTIAKQNRQIQQLQQQLQQMRRAYRKR